MTDTTFELSDPMRRRLAGIHARNADGSLTPMDFELPTERDRDASRTPSLGSAECLPNSPLTKRDALLVYSPGLREI
jgi:hypothetical protein